MDSHPVDAMDAGHRDIRRHAQLIERLAAHLRWKGVDGEACDAARIVLRFFDGPAGTHHREEEIDLFIAVEHCVPSAELNAARALLHRLRADHEKIAAQWADLRPSLVALAAGDAAELTVESARRFAQMQARHIELEETQLLPLARRVLDGRVVSALGAAIARRRGHRVVA